MTAAPLALERHAGFRWDVLNLVTRRITRSLFRAAIAGDRRASRFRGRTASRSAATMRRQVEGHRPRAVDGRAGTGPPLRGPDRRDRPLCQLFARWRSRSNAWVTAAWSSAPSRSSRAIAGALHFGGPPDEHRRIFLGKRLQRRGGRFGDDQRDDGGGIPESHRPSRRSSRRALTAAPFLRRGGFVSTSDFGRGAGGGRRSRRGRAWRAGHPQSEPDPATGYGGATGRPGRQSISGTRFDLVDNRN